MPRVTHTSQFPIDSGPMAGFGIEEAYQQALREAPSPEGGPDYPAPSPSQMGGFMPRVLNGVGGFAAELTGVPSIVRGAGNVMRGYDEGSTLRTLGGLGEAALGVLPGAVALRSVAALRPIATATTNALAGSLPRIAATVGLATVPTEMAEASSSRSKNIRSAIESDPDVIRLRRSLEELRGGGAPFDGAAFDREATALQQQMMARSDQLLQGIQAEARRGGWGPQKMRAAIDAAVSGDAVLASMRERLGTIEKRRADAEAAARAAGQGRIAGIERQLQDAERRAEEGYLETAPFRERHPHAMPFLWGGAAALTAGVPLSKGVLRGIKDRRLLKKTTDEARAGGFGSEAADLLKRRTERMAMEYGWPGALASTAGNAAKGAFIMGEASMLPEQLDYVMFSPGENARERAAAEFAKPSYWTERAIPALMGMGLGVTANSYGRMLGGKPDLDAARTVLDRVKQAPAPAPLAPPAGTAPLAPPTGPAPLAPPTTIAAATPATQPYPSRGGELRDFVRNAFTETARRNGGVVDPAAFSTMIQNGLKAAGAPPLEGLYKRAAASSRALEAGREPFGSRRLAVPLAAGGVAGAASMAGEAEAKPDTRPWSERGTEAYQKHVKNFGAMMENDAFLGEVAQHLDRGRNGFYAAVREAAERHGFMIPSPTQMRRLRSKLEAARKAAEEGT